MNIGLWHLIAQMDFISKFTLFIMFLMSVTCWTFFILKFKSLNQKIKDIKTGLNSIDSANNIEELISKTTTIRTSFAGNLIAKYLTSLKNLTKNISVNENQALKNALEQTLEQELIKEEQVLTLFSTSAQVAPLIGLFGTVWGLIHAFIGISKSASADIAAVAPGIAEALITTLAGLIVAIPALIMLNYTQRILKNLENNLMLLTDKCYSLMVEILIKTSFNHKAQEPYKRDAL